MKLSLVLVVGSLAVNAALLAVYVSRPHPTPSVNGAEAIPANSGSDHARSRLGPEGKNLPTPSPSSAGPASADAARDAEKAWAKLNTGDVRALAARLRAAGFPPNVVRAVVSNQVGESFKARRATLLPQNEALPFWSTDRNSRSMYDAKTLSALRELGQEQSKLVREIAGENLDAGPAPLTENERRRFGDLPRDKVTLLQRIEQDYNELRSDMNTATRGIMLPEDREKLAVLEREKRADFGQVLTPAELEEYVMRTSSTTAQLRTALTTFNATEAEFRAIYAAQAAFDDKYSYEKIGGAFSPELSREREQSRQLTSEQIKSALGEQRYAEFTRSSDREFQQLYRIAQQSGVPVATAAQTYDLRTAAAQESGLIFENKALNVEQKRAALKTLADNTRGQIAETLGADAGSSYLKVAGRWLDAMERGSAVSFPDGGGMRLRGLPANRPPGSVPANNGTPPRPVNPPVPATR